MVEKSSRREDKRAPKERLPREQKEEVRDAPMLEDRELVIKTSEKIEIVQSFD